MDKKLPGVKKVCVFFLVFVRIFSIVFLASVGFFGFCCLAFWHVLFLLFLLKSKNTLKTDEKMKHNLRKTQKRKESTRKTQKTSKINIAPVQNIVSAIISIDSMHKILNHLSVLKISFDN